jgi:hypothetical protein
VRQAPSAAEKLRIFFRNALRMGYVKNAELDPAAPSALGLVVDPGETFIVKVDSTRGWHYRFSDRRLLQERDGTVGELLRYEAIQKAHWMFGDLWERLVRSPDDASKMKSEHHDRLEIELPTGNIALEGLDQAYRPALNFFWWVIQLRTSST